MVNRKLYQTLIFAALIVWSATCAYGDNDISQAINDLKGYKPTQSAKDKVVNYFSQDQTQWKNVGRKIILRLNESIQKSAAANIKADIKLDGEDADWIKAGAVISDPSGDVGELDKTADKGVFQPLDDIVGYGFTADNNNLYFMLKPAAMPTDRDYYDYNINLLSLTGKMLYKICWRMYENSISYYDEDNQLMGNVPDNSGSVFIKKNVFEAKVPKKILKDLPSNFYIEAMSNHYHRNAADLACNELIYGSLASLKNENNYSLELFCKYAEKIDLDPNDPFPLAQAIVDAFPYKMVTGDVKEEVVNDGLAMIAEAKGANKYNYSGQKRLSERGFENILLWADRGIGLSYQDPIFKFYSSLPKSGGKYNKEVYEFLFLTPKSLALCRQMVEKNGLLVPGNISATCDNIQKWLQKKEDYRADDFFLGKLFAYDPKKYSGIYYAYKNDDKPCITTIGDDEILKWTNQSASFQVGYLYKNGVYFGNCVDVAVVSSAFAKSIGISPIIFHYDSILDNDQETIHTFPAYYDSNANLYRCFIKGENIVQGWAKKGSKVINVGYSIEVPITWPYWNIRAKKLYGYNGDFSSNVYPAKVSEADWEKIDNVGLSAERVKNLLLTAPIRSLW
ncbi:MAG: hypothetical protein WCV91_07140 [Candidatus Margulisiibacteriota bacterium]